MNVLLQIYYLLIIVVGFGALIFVHELGHFIAAKWAGIRTEAFAVGMGPVAISWRKGMGVRFGSTAKEYEKRVRAMLADESHGAPKELSLEAMYKVGDKLGIGETEYSLRWLPIGGFVKMLGQEDANPNYVSSDPRSYQLCSIPKRMVVVSAGVIMNILLAMVLFVIAFMVGVRFEAPIVGEVGPNLPAGRTMAENATPLGITEPGLMPGDVVLAIDGKPARTFADIQIASAMSKPGVPVSLVVEREGYNEPLRFELSPEQDSTSRLLSIGIAPGSSAHLSDHDLGAVSIQEELDRAGLADSGVKPGMQMVAADGQPVHTFEQFERILAAKDGADVATSWQALGDAGQPTGPTVTGTIAPAAEFERLIYPNTDEDGKQYYDSGVLGMSPLVEIGSVDKKSANLGVLKVGDVVLRLGDVVAPKRQQAIQEIRKHTGSSINMLVLRDGAQKEIVASVSSKGQIGISLVYAWELPNIAAPMSRVGVQRAAGENTSVTPTVEETAIAPLNLMPGDRIVEIDGRPITDWTDIRKALRAAARNADKDKGATVDLAVAREFWKGEPEHHTLTIPPDECAVISRLGWSSSLPSFVFDPLQTTLSANGNPLTAISMGVSETKKLIMLVYLTIDRLVRGSVGVEQLRGPVGIVDLGSKIIPQGAMYFLFFLGMISVNLAVINFLPLPIVDGGLFLYLIYEKFKGKPPSVAFQNVATVVGLVLIGTIFLVTFYNDVMRLIT